uniref:Uncharacterized protein n=1 Tax=Panagrolaimus davidi TaxID=227884 RepID=A0A914Q0Y1_9BILA
MYIFKFFVFYYKVIILQNSYEPHLIFDPLKDRLKKYEEECEETGEEPRKLFIVWEDAQKAGSGGTHPGRLNLPPQSGQIFSIYKTNDGEPPKHGLYYGLKADGSDSVRQVPYFSAHLAPAIFPLMYLFGQDGWHPNILKLNTKNPPAAPPLSQQQQTQQQPYSALSSQWPHAPQLTSTAAISSPSQQQSTTPPPPHSTNFAASTPILQHQSTTASAQASVTQPPNVQLPPSNQQQPTSPSLQNHVPSAQQQQQQQNNQVIAPAANVLDPARAFAYF